MLKRLFDIVAALTVIILFMPVILIIFIIVRVSMGTPVVFQQVRPGLYGKLFTIYKFRTMNVAASVELETENDQQRLTAIGQLLRSTSLDELPTMFNVLRGDMSLVGPRPLLVEYLPLYTQEQARRHEVRPGISGWAQVNGRNSISWEEKFKLDVWYVDNQSIYLDIKIILMTLFKVFKREGVSQDGHVTMSKFAGTNDNE